MRTDLCEQRRLFSRVAERIDLPADLRSTAFAELVTQELSAQTVLVDDGVVVSCCLVVHAPSARDELEAT